MKRRQLLLFTGSMLATLGISQLDIQRRSLRYAKTLAQNTPRKLALLVGINNYINKSKLYGCITDVELQKQLLIHRFGFQPADILSVTDDTEIKPTRDGILTAFEEHLIKQAKPGDVVVFHFSGHGSRVADKDKDEPDGLNSTFVPIDQTEVKRDGRNLVSDIMGHTLFLLMSAIDSENVTVVLDSCHSGGGKRGNLIVRSLDRSSPFSYYPNDQELEYQKQWLSRLKMSEAEFIQTRQQTVAKGVVIASAARDELAADAPFDGFLAGAFTYAMTQYLWQETNNQKVISMLGKVSRITAKYSTTGQVPELEAKKNTDKEERPTYLLKKQTPPAEAVVIEVVEKKVNFWLGGVNAESLEIFDKDAVFAWVDKAGKERGKIQSTSRNGLIGSGKVIAGQTPPPGALLQEIARAIPTDLTLKIGLDNSLGNAAIQTRGSLQQIPRIKPVPLQRGEVHYILGRMTETLATEARENDSQKLEVPEVGSFGLYTPGLELIPDSFGKTGETLEEALQRLRPKFKSLLAARLVKLTLNADSSQLKALALMKTLNQEFVASTFTVRGTGQTEAEEIPSNTPIKVEAGVPLLAVGTQVQLQITNREDRDLYMAVLVVDSSGEMGIVFPNTWVEEVDAALVKSGERKLLPEAGVDRFKLTVSQPLGNTEVLVIASVTPLRETLKTLKAIAAARGLRSGELMDLADTDVVDALLEDINAGSRGGLVAEFDPTARVVDTTKIGAMLITFRVINSLT
ncbi:caspase family protein [Okeania sp. SIO2B3]|uniref:caspase family protein n=1 Tax=Okeania sp. SIO2B3 TaxID=2607784 RepID=UPI0013C04599|nr:caspase family protein [Okeania sp. SIO2B3]NET44262.1 DUF4384 domain-containing protein [Okeania sp. SIO2B3]